MVFMGALLVQWRFGPPVPKTIAEANNPDTAARTEENMERKGKGDTETERKGERGRGDSKGDPHSRYLECGGHCERHQVSCSVVTHHNARLHVNVQTFDLHVV